MNAHAIPDRRGRTAHRAVLLLFLLSCTATGLILAGCDKAPARDSAPADRLTLVTPSGRHEITLEIADTPAKKAMGLMYRTEMKDGHGMLFLFDPPQVISMWMKNTYISLDMIFIRADGRILRIAENTEPESTRVISSGGLARAVLEVPAGTAQKYGIAPGDRVSHPLFSKR